MAKKRITRKKVNDPIVDTALRDIYDKLEELQPEINQTITSRAPTVGMMTTVTTDANVTSMATYTQDGWLVDVNSNFQPVNSTRGFNAIKGIKGVDKKPIKNESVVYDEKSRIPVTTLKFDDMAISQTPQAYDEKGQMKFINDAFTINTTALALNAALNYSSGTAQSLQLISNAEDSSVIFRDGATPKYSIGYDQSDAGKFKIGTGSTLHTSTIFTLDTSGNLLAAGTITDGSGNVLGSGGASALNDLSDVSYSSGDLTITGLDTIISGALTIDSSADIELNADGGNITFKDNTTELFKIQSGGVRFQDMDGIFFNVDDLDKIYGDGDDIVIAKDDTDVIFVKDTEVTTALPLKVKESAAAVSDTAAYGQIWIKNNTPNELAFTDDAGTDIIGVGKYMYDIQRVGYYSTSAAASYLPMNGYIIEGTSQTGRNEYQAFVAPYNGTLEKIMWRSEIAQNGTFRNLIWESTDGTEVPGTIHGRWDPVVDVADDTTVEFDYNATPTSGTNVLTKGNIYAISIDPASAPNDTNATVVFKWDITS